MENKKRETSKIQTIETDSYIIRNIGPQSSMHVPKIETTIATRFETFTLTELFRFGSNMAASANALPHPLEKEATRWQKDPPVTRV